MVSFVLTNFHCTCLENLNLNNFRESEENTQKICSVERHLVRFQIMKSDRPLELGRRGNASVTNASPSSESLGSSV